MVSKDMDQDIEKVVFTEEEKRACDEGEPHLPFCLALYVLFAAGRRERAAEMYRAAPQKRRIRRTLRRFGQWMSKE